MAIYPDSRLHDARPLLARIARGSRDQLGLAAGREVYAQVKSTVLIA